MLYYMFKLKFQTPVHFGADVPGLGLEKSMMTCHADTFFSGLCQEALGLYGQEGLERVVAAAVRGELLVSDLLPYAGEDLYIPRPVVALEAQGVDPSLKKRLKRITHISVGELGSYLRFLEGDADAWEPVAPDFGAFSIYPKVAVNYNDGPRPYAVGVFTYRPEAGLYVVLALGGNEDIGFYRKLIESMGWSGLGGKRTSGYGRFELADDEYELDPECSITDSDGTLARLLLAGDCEQYITLSVVCPAPGDWTVISDPKATYTLVQRKGFVQSAAYSDRFLKRRPLVMFNAGSCFPGRLQGQVVDTSHEGAHPVYRYGRALMLGVVA